LAWFRAGDLNKPGGHYPRALVCKQERLAAYAKAGPEQINLNVAV
jgi:hypothetical protein